ncbi:MAG TPA: LysM peptidoglycan-binding domain-containing protein, partial [Fusobacterium ulcerans]|nr:LysM peptidoglycan-binding domain-containing protein [Fusobacterium ulcerans]
WIPHQKYSFAKYLGGVLPIQHYTESLAAMKATKRPVQFIILRSMKSISGIYNTNIKVSVEDYNLIDDADKYGSDIGISIKLKEYKDKSNILMSVVGNVGNKTQYLLTKIRESTKILPKTYTVSPGDTLFTIAKKQLGDGTKAQNLLELNNLPNLIDLTVGQVIRLE